jgi:hypothetical protein
MKNKVLIDTPLGAAFPTKTGTGFVRKYLVTDFSKAKSVVTIFCKEMTGLPDAGDLVVDCNEFCFASK